MVFRKRLLVAISILAGNVAAANSQQLSAVGRLALLEEARALNASGDHAAAAVAFEQLLKATPDHGGLQLELGDVYLSLDRAQDALPLLKNGLAAGYGEEEWVAYTIAQVHAYVGDDAEALDWLERAANSSGAR
jgi:tetratricopeptide (TPR) repeat protein